MNGVAQATGTRRRVAVVGGGIMGSATALLLARRRIDVVLYEKASAPLSGASRWNEGKVHLGYLYSADPSLATARRILPGGLAFRRLLEELIGRQVEGVSQTDDLFLVHRDSLVSPKDAMAYFGRVEALTRGHPAARDYFVDLSRERVRQLSATELASVADTHGIVAGFAVPERSIDTQWVADQLSQALNAEPRIELRLNTRVLAVASVRPNLAGPFRVRTEASHEEGFDAVVNAAWDGRAVVDASLGIAQSGPTTQRYRVALFIDTREPIDIPCAVICTGPFGDVKQYGRGALYASWYPTGMLIAGESAQPPPLPRLDEAERARLADEMLSRLGQLIPAVRRIRFAAVTMRIEGGWVVAAGRGRLDDLASALHRRDQIGIHRSGSYFSVDTGKYSVAPWLAVQIADAIAPPSERVFATGLSATSRD